VSGWDELVAVALIGTDRRPLAAAPPPGSPEGLGAVLAERGVEDRVLASAAAWTVARRAGARVGAAPAAVEPAEADPRPVCSAAAADRLQMLLDSPDRLLVPEWLHLARRAGVRPPPEVVPALLDYAVGSPHFQDEAGEAAGPLGRWLAARAPHWAFATEAVWDGGERYERLALLERLRSTDPVAARELLESTFADETWEDRELFVSALLTGLSDADEPFL
jgi:hypothetical protein